MLVRLLAVSLCMLDVISGCKPSTESKLVGTWRLGNGATYADIVLHADHSAQMITHIGGSLPETHTSPGHWRADGDHFFVEWDDNPDEVKSMAKKPSKIVSVTDDTLVLAPGEFPQEDPNDARTWKTVAKRVK